MMMIPRKRNDFDLFRDLFEGDDFFPNRRESQIMKTDIKEKKDKYIIEMDLPGYEKENINLSLKDGYLEVSAKVEKEENSGESERFIQKERFYGECSRNFYVGDWVEETDIKEKKDKYIIEMDLPGYEKENINLLLKDGYLEVTAKVSKEENSEDKEKFVHKERFYGHCSRSFYVGEQVTEKDIHAEFKNGILKVDIPKKEDKKELPEAKRIEIE